jgi:ABC-type molybdate transport system substrate-binding protein
MKHLLSWIAVVAFVFGISSGARAQGHVTLLSPDPLKREVDEIVKNFQMKTGVNVQESYGTGVGTRKTVQEGAQDGQRR